VDHHYTIYLWTTDDRAEGGNKSVPFDPLMESLAHLKARDPRLATARQSKIKLPARAE
jgi:hypothetical protein